MTAQLLASELNNLIQESKRKHNDLRQVPPLKGQAHLAFNSRGLSHMLMIIPGR